MSGKALIDQIRHYQKDIERCPENSERMIRCIKRLYVLPVLVQHLQETGVGRSVNALRKYNGEVGEAAKALVAKWKAMVAAEESSEEGEQLQEITPEKVVQEHKHTKPNKSEKTHSSRRHSNEEEHKKKVHSSRSEHKFEKRSSEKHSSSKHKYSKHDKGKEHEESDESNDSSSNRKRKKHTSPERKSNHSKSKRAKVVEESSSSDSDEESSEDDSCSRNGDVEREESDRSEAEENGEEGQEEEEEEEGGEEEEEAESESNEEEESERQEKSEEESESSGGHKHRSKHKHSHHRSSHSSRSKSSHSSRDKHHSERKREDSKTKHSHSHSKKKSSSQDINALIKENEKKVKREKEEKPEKEKQEKDKNKKKEKQVKVKIEKNEDGSIDAGSGASFAEALLGGVAMPSPKKTKKKPSSSHSKKAESGVDHASSSSSRSHKSKESSSRSKESSSKHHSSSKDKDLTKMPEMLMKPVKQESISLDISSTLPEISPHYKPLPHVPHVPQAIGIRRHSKTNEEEAMCSIMTTKYQRTKVYSGNKSGHYNYVPSLYSLCIQLLYDNIDAVEFTGGVPYDILKPLLQKLNADQLFVLEHHNPYLVEDTDSMWEFHCKKDFRSASRQELESWRELYLRCMEEREKKLKALTENITKSMAKSTPVRQAKLAYVDSVVKPPRNVARKQAKYGTGSPVKAEIIKKAVVGGHTPGVVVKDVVPPPHPPSRVAAQIIKKKKAPLMAKALQLIKGNRFKR